MAKQKQESAGPTSWSPAHEADELIASLIAQDHPGLQGVRIECHFKNKELYDRGKRVFVKVSKKAGLIPYLASKNGAFFVLEIFTRAWELAEPKVRLFMLDNALCSLSKSDSGKLSLKAPDVVAFTGAIKRYGLMTDELQILGRVVRSLQPELKLEEGGIPDDEAKRFTDTPLSETVAQVNGQTAKRGRGRPRRDSVTA